VLKKGEGHCFKFVHTYYFTEVSLTNLLERAGLRVVRSWTMPPQLEANVLFPGNYCSGELNIVASVDGDAASPAVPRRREAVASIVAAHAAGRKRDRLHAFANHAYRYRPIALVRRILARAFPPKPVFESFWRADGSVDASVFPPLLLQARQARMEAGA